MKKTILMHILVAAVLLAGCAGGTQTPTVAAVGVGINTQLKTDYANALPLLSQLAVGTLKLDGTGNAVDKTEASQLLPLWKVLRTLSTSNTAAVEEINAAIRQIETTMKPEQVKAIAGMQLTQQDMAAVFAQRGVAFGSGSGGTLTPEQQATRQARQSGGGGGGFGGGGFGGGGFGGGGGGGGQQMPAAQQTAMAAARSGSGRSSSGINSGVVNAVIQYLTSKS